MAKAPFAYFLALIFAASLWAIPNCGTASKTEIPQTVYVHESVPDHYIESLQDAAAQWNAVLELDLFRFHPIKVSEDFAPWDQKTVIYWTTEDIGYDAVASFNFESDEHIGKNIQCDIRVNALRFALITPMSKLALAYLVMHELGHCIGLDHENEPFMLMHPIAGSIVSLNEIKTIYRKLGIPFPND